MNRATDCPVCAEAGYPELFIEANAEQRQRFINFSQDTYAGVMDDWLDTMELVVMHCAACGHFWYRDQPGWDQLSAMYDATARRHAAKGVSLKPTSRSRIQMARLFRLVGNGGAQARPTLLDYGSGFGRWARAANHAGFAVTAFEPSATRGSEGSTHNADFELVDDLAALDGQHFDAINIEQVLEHIGDPFSALTALHKYCHAGTVVRITVPNLNRNFEGEELWSAWPFDGKRAHTLAPFEHLQGFVPHSLRALAKRAGFREVPLLDAFLADPVLALRRAVRSIYPAGDSTHVFLQPLAEHAGSVSNVQS